MAATPRPMHPLRVAVPLGVGALIALLPVPHGLDPHAWYYFAIFAAVIAAVIAEPIPAAAAGLIGITLAAISGVVFPSAQFADPAFKFPAEALKWGLAGFANSTVWLIFAAYVFAMGYEKTGLGRRLALRLVQALGARTLGLGYAIALSDLILAPFTPSNTARSGGTIFPIIRNIPALYDSSPGESSRRIGAYLMWVAFATTCVTGSMFITALAPNLFALELVRQATGVQVSWLQWARGFLPVGLGLVAAIPWLTYRLYPPEIRQSAAVPAWAARELRGMGPMARAEIVMAGLVVVALVLWVAAGDYIDATTVALLGISLMLVAGVVTWDEILANRAAWNVLAWFATMVVLADGLVRVGFIAWLGRGLAPLLAGHAPLAVLVGLVAMFFFLHYLFAGLSAHVSALLPLLATVGAAVPGLPVRTLALLLVYCVGLMGVLTPYGCGPAPVYYGSGYIARRAFWALGGAFGLIFLAALLLVGLLTLR